MQSIAIIFVPLERTRDDVAIAARKHAEAADIIETAKLEKAEPFQRAEQMPLWRWFIDEA